MVLLDTHPDYMNFDGAKARGAQYPVRRYAELLEYIGSNYAGQYWHALPREMAAYTSRTYKDRADHREAPLTSLITKQHSPSSRIDLREPVAFPIEKEDSPVIGSSPLQPRGAPPGEYVFFNLSQSGELPEL